jgi:DNA-binding response OmpR family regulator
VTDKGMGGGVLLIDDDEDIRDTIKSLLELRGYRVLTATDGADGLECMRRDPPSLVILDLMMPGMNGEEFRAAQLREPALAKIPVVVLSGAGRIGDKASMLGVEAVAKPIDLQILFDTVERFCRPGTP